MHVGIALDIMLKTKEANFKYDGPCLSVNNNRTGTVRPNLYKILFNKYIHNYVEREIQLVGRE